MTDPAAALGRVPRHVGCCCCTGHWVGCLQVRSQSPPAWCAPMCELQSPAAGTQQAPAGPRCFRAVPLPGRRCRRSHFRGHVQKAAILELCSNGGGRVGGGSAWQRLRETPADFGRNCRPGQPLPKLQRIRRDAMRTAPWERGQVGTLHLPPANGGRHLGPVPTATHPASRPGSDYALQECAWPGPLPGGCDTPHALDLHCSLWLGRGSPLIKHTHLPGVPPAPAASRGPFLCGTHPTTALRGCCPVGGQQPRENPQPDPRCPRAGRWVLSLLRLGSHG